MMTLQAVSRLASRIVLFGWQQANIYSQHKNDARVKDRVLVAFNGQQVDLTPIQSTLKICLAGSYFSTW